MLRGSIIVCLAILVSGCGSGTDSAVGGVSQSEADGLNNAAAMLDQPAAAGSLTAPPRAEPKAPSAEPKALPAKPKTPRVEAKTPRVESKTPPSKPKQPKEK